MTRVDYDLIRNSVSKRDPALGNITIASIVLFMVLNSLLYKLFKGNFINKLKKDTKETIAAATETKDSLPARSPTMYETISDIESTVKECKEYGEILEETKELIVILKEYAHIQYEEGSKRIRRHSIS